MSTVAELLVKIGADTSDLRKEIAATKRQLKTAFGPDGLELSSDALTVLGGMTAALGALGVVAVQAGGELENVKVAMTNMLGSAEKATVFVKELQDFAAHTPFEFNEVTKASQKFLAFGFTAEQIIPTLTAVGDAAAGVGAGQDGVNRLTIALGQIAAKGKLASQEMMQVTEMGIPAWQLLADKLGTDVAGAQDQVTKGLVDSKTALEALIGGMESRYGGMMSQQSTTILGTWSNLMDGLGQVASQAGLQIADALDLTSVFSEIGDWLGDFATAIEEGGFSNAIANCIPPEAQLAIVAFGTAITAVAIPALYAMGATAAAMLAPFVAAVGTAVAAVTPFIAAITAATTALYALWSGGVTVGDVLDLMGVKTETLSSTWEAMKSAFSAVGSLLSSTITALKPVFVAFGAVAGAVVAGILEYFGMLINAGANFLTTVSNIIANIAEAFEWLVSAAGSAIDSISSVLGNMADSILPGWANSGLSTISNFVDTAVGWLNSLISKIFETNSALADAGGEQNTSTDTFAGTESKKWQMPDYQNFKGKDASADFSGGNDSKGSDLASEAASTSKSIEEEWVRTFSTRSELLDRWYTEETAELEKSRSANGNYERDKQRLTELYTQKHISAVQEEAKKEQEIVSGIRDISFQSKQSAAILDSDAAEQELLKMELAHEKTVGAIEDRWTSLANTFIGLTSEEQEVFLAALDERNIAYEQSADGELSFQKEMLAEKLAAEKEYEDEVLAYHKQCKDLRAEIDESYRTLDMERLQEVLTEESAIRLNDMEAQKTMMDTYMEAFLAAHSAISQLIAGLYEESLSGLETAFTDILTGAESARAAFESLGKSMVKVIAQYFAKMASGMIVTAVLGKQKDSESTAQTVANAATAEAAWSPPAWLKLVVEPGAAGVATGLLTAGIASAAAIGSAASALTSAVSGTSSVSTDGIKQYASGGLFKRPMLGILGDGAEDEVALPLNRAVFENIASGITRSGGMDTGSCGSVAVAQNIYGDINNAADLDDLWRGLNDVVAAGIKGY